MGGKKNTKGGKGHKKGKRQTDNKRELEFKDEDQDYAQVIKMLGDGRVLAECLADNHERICHIRGKFKKRVWIEVGDIVLVGLRGFQDDKADIILKYSPDEARTLKAYGELPDRIVIGGGGVQDDEDHGKDDLAFGSDGLSEEEPNETKREVDKVDEKQDEDDDDDWDAKIANL